MPATVLLALGSNRRHGRHGSPAGVVAAAVAALEAAGLRVTARSTVRATAPLGPGGRAYANAAVAVETGLPLPDLLTLLQQIERDFGRRAGRRWGARVLDLDILASGSAVVRSRRLTVPHAALAGRRFVLDPLVEIAPRWRHPLLHSTAAQLHARAHRPKASVASP